MNPKMSPAKAAKISELKAKLKTLTTALKTARKQHTAAERALNKARMDEYKMNERLSKLETA